VPSRLLLEAATEGVHLRIGAFDRDHAGHGAALGRTDEVHGVLEHHEHVFPERSRIGQRIVVVTGLVEGCVDELGLGGPAAIDRGLRNPGASGDIFQAEGHIADACQLGARSLEDGGDDTLAPASGAHACGSARGSASSFSVHGG